MKRNALLRQMKRKTTKKTPGVAKARRQEASANTVSKTLQETICSAGIACEYSNWDKTLCNFKYEHNLNRQRKVITTKNHLHFAGQTHLQSRWQGWSLLLHSRYYASDASNATVLWLPKRPISNKVICL